jgi:hypothetical protein
MNPTLPPIPLALEWQTLQDNHEQHERNALHIKLTCMVMLMLGLAAHVSLVWLGFVVALLWVQEGIVKTYQARLSDRLLRVEALLCQAPTDHGAMQLHTEWQKQRPRGAALITSYALSACRPTVAFPYVPLLIIGALAKLYLTM